MDNKDTDNLETKENSVIETDSLESGGNGPVQAAPGQPAAAADKAPKLPFRKRIAHHVNIYLLLFILVLVLAGAGTVVMMFQQKSSSDPTISSQAIPTDTLKELAKSDATVGDPKQVLNVQSNAVFAGKVLIRDSLDVAGQIHVNGSLSLPGITVSGDSTFDSVQVNKALNIGGDTSVLGQLSVKKNLSVSGSGSFGGAITAPQIATSQLQILSDLNLTSHIVAGGATPGRGTGGALGGGGTASVSGSDTAGSVNINTGGGTSAGCMVTVNFVGRFNSTPHVVITPTTSSAASTSYYVNRSTTSFSVCAATPPPANSSLGFDYIVLG
jgi:hypothetical protein